MRRGFLFSMVPYKFCERPYKICEAHIQKLLGAMEKNPTVKKSTIKGHDFLDQAGDKREAWFLFSVGPYKMCGAPIQNL